MLAQHSIFVFKVEQLESGLKNRKDSINQHLDDLNEKLKVEREKTRQEVNITQWCICIAYSETKVIVQ